MPRRPKITSVGSAVLSEVLAPDEASRQPEVTIGVFVEEEGFEDFPTLVKEPAPDGFPPELLPYLADFMARGFNRAINEWTNQNSLDKRPRGRPIDPVVQRIGEESSRLRQQGLTWGQIALQVCDRKGQPGHRCGKKCADRVRQAAEPYLRPRKTR